jgi:hypothetical protein
MQETNSNRSSSQVSSKTNTSLHSTETGTKNCKTLDDTTTSLHSQFKQLQSICKYKGNEEHDLGIRIPLVMLYYFIYVRSQNYTSFIIQLVH